MTGDVVGVSQNSKSTTLRSFLGALVKHMEAFVHFTSDICQVETQLCKPGFNAVDGTLVAVD